MMNLHSSQDNEASGADASTFHKAGKKKAVTKKQLLKAISDLEKNPEDRIRILGDIGIAVVGGGSFVMAAPTVAAIAGATTIPIVTSSAAKLFGITVVTATPVGWFIGMATAGGILSYGVSRLIRNGAMFEGRKRELLEKFKEQLHESEAKERANSITPAESNEFIVSLREVIEKGVLSPVDAFRLIEGVASGIIPISQGCELVTNVLQESIRS